MNTTLQIKIYTQLSNKDVGMFKGESENDGSV